ncbi:multicopper oxidase family protein [Entomobacter blattae]|uniref:Multicopper oxidase MmcO n=1 Tax=Entomobacter blattae TaxID=2762277 RepID=A0A7H1NT69_9PROT|nr:multicopper oxidase family protein [Entomobacter blattae]QNT78979.1 Multicopper oxidase MmcO [Entomobacter blattae]
MIRRRQFLLANTFAASTVFLSEKSGYARSDSSSAQPLGGEGTLSRKADYTLTIEEGRIEPKPGHILQTYLYNGHAPGPLLKMKEGQEIVVDIHNKTPHPEILHWHGFILPGELDGSMEEGTPFILPQTTIRQAFTPTVAGLRAYHTHVRAGKNLTLGLYTGLIGPVYIEPKQNPGRYDREVFLTLKEYGPAFSAEKMDDEDYLLPKQQNTALKAELEKKQAANKALNLPDDLDLVYEYYTINGHCLGFGEPIKVKQGEKVLLHILNGSATEARSLALPDHSFKVVALDGNPVPVQASVPVLWLGALERVSAIVEMNNPGVWVMGDVQAKARNKGMGIIVEYAGQQGKAQWKKPTDMTWDYRLFSKKTPSSSKPDGIFDFHISEHHNPDRHINVNLWTINGKTFNSTNKTGYYPVEYGKRYRLRFYNPTDEAHPLHLHRHNFEVVNIAGSSISGLMKDVIMVGSCQTLEVDFIADQKGASLFHCHMQHHMDYGFMAVFECQ